MNQGKLLFLSGLLIEGICIRLLTKLKAFKNLDGSLIRYASFEDEGSVKLDIRGSVQVTFEAILKVFNVVKLTVDARRCRERAGDEKLN